MMAYIALTMIIKEDKSADYIYAAPPFRMIDFCLGIAEVVVDLGRNTVLEQVLIVLDGLLIVALGVLGVGVLLGDSRGREAEA